MNLYNKPRKTDRKVTVPWTPLQHLSSAVNLCFNFRIQYCHIPRDLHQSQKTQVLSETIIAMQKELAVSIRADYERQRDNILDKRKHNELAPKIK